MPKLGHFAFGTLDRQRRGLLDSSDQSPRSKRENGHAKHYTRFEQCEKLKTTSAYGKQVRKPRQNPSHYYISELDD